MWVLKLQWSKNKSKVLSHVFKFSILPFHCKQYECYNVGTTKKKTKKTNDTLGLK